MYSSGGYGDSGRGGGGYGGGGGGGGGGGSRGRARAGAAYRLHREIEYVGKMIKQSKRRITCVRPAAGGPLLRARASPLFSSFARACVGWKK
jgi:hypothetical protein